MTGVYAGVYGSLTRTIRGYPNYFLENLYLKCFLLVLERVCIMLYCYLLRYDLL